MGKERPKKNATLVHREDDGIWEEFASAVAPPSRITGKYMFFSAKRELLVQIAVDELSTGGFPRAKINSKGMNLTDDYGLFLYYADDSRRTELADKYKGIPGLKYRYWKSDEDTERGTYSKEFLNQLDPGLRKVFERKRNR